MNTYIAIRWNYCREPGTPARVPSLGKGSAVCEGGVCSAAAATSGSAEESDSTRSMIPKGVGPPPPANTGAVEGDELAPPDQTGAVEGEEPLCVAQAAAEGEDEVMLGIEACQANSSTGRLPR